MPDEPAEKPSRWRFQFGIASLLATMVLVSVLSTSLAGLLQWSEQPWPRATYVAITVAAPLAVLLLAAGYYWLRRGVAWLAGFRQREEEK